MSADAGEASDPFPLLCTPTHHGLRRNVGVGLFFTADVPADDRDAIEALVPPPLRHELVWSRDFCYAGTPDRFDTGYDAGDRAALSAAIDAWLHATHAAAALAFVYLTDLPELAAYPAWASRSVARVPDLVLPWLQRHWSSGGPARAGAEQHATTILDNLSYFLLALYADATPDMTPALRARLLHVADIICASDSGCGAELWRDELVAKLGGRVG